ncbi:hypothetical protein DERP_012528 [Dermatophagoides pteronyssinus]|uniref:Uncharacterized protein n=1 Tax=Dermatophagoides pteronyssinus TaxID=6956 RepID=A0ABQ8IUQ6_DERPT|nr:hypothetical protein DERP_012528 [Dermatophagoides pteronyssinus]
MVLFASFVIHPKSLLEFYGFSVHVFNFFSMSKYLYLYVEKFLCEKHVKKRDPNPKSHHHFRSSHSIWTQRMKYLACLEIKPK